MGPDRNERIGWSCASALLIIFVSGLMVPLRDVIDNTNVALILVVFVVGAAVFGGRTAGVTAAIVAAVSFNFFFTKPYLTLRVADGEDVVTMVLLLVVGLAVGELAILHQRRRREVVSQAEGAHRLEDAVACLTRDASTGDTWDIVRSSLVDELGARSARYVPGAGSAKVPLLTRSGRVVPNLSRWTGRGFELPELLSIPVVSGTGVLGRIEVEASPGRAVSIDERRVAVALADVYAVALQRSDDQRERTI